jgi:hypothetical protein
MKQLAKRQYFTRVTKLFPPNSVLNRAVLDTMRSGQQNVKRICCPFFLLFSFLSQFNPKLQHRHVRLHFVP